MLYFLNEKHDCTGCTACYAACPVHCIRMKADEEGFLYPEAGDSCIYCKKCEQVCPQNSPMKSKAEIEQIAFAALSKNFIVWQKSASGGAFTEICTAWGEKTVIVGAAWNGLHIEHRCVEGVKNIAPIRKSKYIASELKDSFQTIKKFLAKGKQVIFCGTPCQVAGLRAYLNIEYENLLLVDLICHGVGSPKVFISCIAEMEKQYNYRIETYEFRSKRKVFNERHLVKVGFKDTRKFMYLLKDPYNQLFLNQNCLRPSCGEHCNYRNVQRQGDITIADFNDMEKVFPQLSGSKKNFSTIVFNTQKGSSIQEKLKKQMIMLPCSIEAIKKYNPLFFRQTWFSEQRDTFFTDYLENPEKAILKWTTPSILYHRDAMHMIFDYLPEKVRCWIRNIREV